MAETAVAKFAFEQTGRRLGRLAFQIHQTLKSRDADAVHDLRVAVRRLSQALRVFKPHFRGEVRKIRRKLKQITNLAGQVRNCDIALKLLSNAERQSVTHLRPKLENRRHESERALAAVLDEWMDRKSSLKWRNIVTRVGTANGEPSSKTAIVGTARRLLPRMSREFFERGNRAAKTNSSPRDLHEFRITAKKFRYTLEIFDSFYGRSLHSSLDHIRHAQGLLGDINDCDTVRHMLAQYKGADRLTPWLKKRQRRRILEFQRFWAETLAADEETRRWSAFLSRPSPTGADEQVKKPASRAERISRTTLQGNTAVA